jgi:ABC-type Mn2+/Zn2+ transport system ATPase subunit
VVGSPSAALSTSLKTRLRTSLGRNGAGKSTLASTSCSLQGNSNLSFDNKSKQKQELGQIDRF